jgi:5-methyltetrahydropteroyltriglutamate--homocysteine methyltransferase
MQQSDQRILTTYVGSLPRPVTLRDLLIKRERDSSLVLPQLAEATESAVESVIAGQLDAGIDIGNNGEQPRVGFSTYVASRMSGFAGESPRPANRDTERFADFAQMLADQRRNASMVNVTPQVVGEVRYTDTSEAQQECEQFIRLHDAAPDQFAETFMTAASPGIITTTMMNNYYDSHEKYLRAVAREMRKEYELIHRHGLLLQIDCPDLAMERSRFFKDNTLHEFQDMVSLHIDALNEALTDIPRDRVRLHVCWGNTNSPHVDDVPLEAILPRLYEANVGALSVELANPRHQHEYKVFRRQPLPDDMLLIPGVIDSTVNYVEHPEVVADRICQVVDAIGERSRVLASTDCGFGTFAGFEAVAPSVVWYKLRTLAEGAHLATQRLWHS